MKDDVELKQKERVIVAQQRGQPSRQRHGRIENLSLNVRLKRTAAVCIGIPQRKFASSERVSVEVEVRQVEPLNVPRNHMTEEQNVPKKQNRREDK